MAAPTIDQIMEQEAGRIDEEILQLNLHTSPWIDLPTTDTWDEERGHTHSILSFDRSLPANPLTWSTVTVSNGEAGGVCLPPKQQLAITRTLREFNMQHTALESPDICVNDLRNTFQAKEQLEAITTILAENQRQAWIDRNRSLYTEFAEHKLVATAGGLVDGGDEWPALPPDVIISGGHLLRSYKQLLRLGGGMKGNLGMVDGKPTFAAILGMENSERISKEGEYRADIRESSRVPELLAPLGVDRMFRGLWLTDDIFPPRSNWDAGAGEYVDVPPYIWDDGKLVENPAYETALCEDVFIYHPDNVHVVYPNPPKDYGKAAFGKPSLRGDWNWLNIQHREDNPDKSYGFFRGVFMSGGKPKFPRFGFVIRALRCDIPVLAASCTES